MGDWTDTRSRPITQPALIQTRLAVTRVPPPMRVSRFALATPSRGLSITIPARERFRPALLVTCFDCT